MADNDDKSKNINKSVKTINGISTEHYEQLESHRYDNVSKKSSKEIELEKKLSDVQRARRAGLHTQEHLDAQEEKYNTEIESVHGKYVSNINEDTADKLERYTRIKDINSRTTTMSRSHSLGKDIRSDRALVGSTSTESLDNRIQQNISRLSEIGSLQAEDIRSRGNEQATPEMQLRAKEMQAIEIKIAEDKKMKDIQGKEGLTSEKQFYKSQELHNRVKGYIGGRELEGRVASGEFGSFEESVKNLSGILDKATEALEEFQKVTSETSSATEEQRKEAYTKKDQAEQKLKEQYDAIGILSRGGGGDTGGKYRNYAAYAGGASSILSNFAVTSEVKSLSLKAGYADVVNDMYLNSEKAAIGGDLNAALSLVSVNQMEAKRKSISTGRAASGILEIGAGIFTAAAGAKIKNPATIAAGLSGAANTSIDLVTGNAQAAAGLQGIQSMQKLDESARFIQTRQMQSYYNLGLSSYQNVAGLGEAGEEMQRSLLYDKDAGQKLANSGVSLQDAVKLMPLLSEAGAFSAAEGFDVIGKAGAAMQKGQMTRESYTSSAAAIMGQGGASGDLETIIQNAMQRGMDNSKNISQMVSATLSLNANIAKSGVGAFSELEKLMDSSVSGLNKFGLDKNLTTPMAQAGLSNLDNMLRSTDVNFGNAVEMSMLTKTFSGASIDQVQQLASMGIGDMALVKGALGRDTQSISKLKAQMKAAGTSSLLFDEEGRLMEDKAGSLIETNIKSMVVNKTSHLGVSANDVMTQLKSGQVTEQVRAAMNLGAPGTAEAAISVLNTTTSTNKKQNTREDNIGASQQVTGAQFQLDQAFQGKEFLDGIAKAANVNLEAMQVAESMIKTAAEFAPQEKWAEISKSAAASFSIPVDKFAKVINEDLKKILSTNQAILNEMLKKLDVSTAIPDAKPIYMKNSSYDRSKIFRGEEQLRLDN